MNYNPLVLAGSAKLQIGPAFFHEGKIDAGGGQVGEVAAAVDGQVFGGFRIRFQRWQASAHVALIRIKPGSP